MFSTIIASVPAVAIIATIFCLVLSIILITSTCRLSSQNRTLCKKVADLENVNASLTRKTAPYKIEDYSTSLEGLIDALVKVEMQPLLQGWRGDPRILYSRLRGALPIYQLFHLCAETQIKPEFAHVTLRAHWREINAPLQNAKVLLRKRYAA